LFNRSTDGGVTWSAPVSIPNSPLWGTLDVGSNHNVFVGAGDAGSSFWCIRSSNANQPGTPTFDQVTPVNMGGSLIFGSINPDGLTGQISLWVDRSGSVTNNNVYMLASVRPPTYSDGTDVMFVRSTDGGLTFSAPHRINDDATVNKWHWFGTFSVAPNGRLDAVWYDTRNAANNTDSQLFYSYSTNGGVTWAANVAVSASFNPQEGCTAEQDRGLHCHRFRQHRWQCSVFRHLQFQPRSWTTRRGHLLRACISNRNSYAYAHTNIYAFSYRHTTAATDILSAPHATAAADAYSGNYSYSYRHRNTCTVTDC